MQHIEGIPFIHGKNKNIQCFYVRRKGKVLGDCGGAWEMPLNFCDSRGRSGLLVPTASWQ